MKNILITGANGMIGGWALKLCLDHPEVRKVTTISRRSLDLAHPKLTQVVHNNFLDLEPVSHALKGQDSCIYCIGVYTGQVPTHEFERITVDYTRAFAKTLKKESPQSTFCFLSGAGADSTEKSKLLFAKEKGKAENILKELAFRSLHIFRPGYIYPNQPSKEPNLMYKLMRPLYKPVSFLYPDIGVTSSHLAAMMVSKAIQAEKGVFILENKAIRKGTPS